MAKIKNFEDIESWKSAIRVTSQQRGLKRYRKLPRKLVS